MSGALVSGEVPFRIHDLTVPSTGSLICSANIVDTSRSIVLATSSSFAIREMVSKCGASIAVRGFFAEEASNFPKTASWAALALHSLQWLACVFFLHNNLSSSSSVIESSPSSWSSTSALSSLLVFSESIELYVGSEPSTELKDCVECTHKRRNWLIVLPSRKQSVADYIVAEGEMLLRLFTVKFAP